MIGQLVVDLFIPPPLSVFHFLTPSKLCALVDSLHVQPSSLPCDCGYDCYSILDYSTARIYLYYIYILRYISLPDPILEIVIQKVVSDYQTLCVPMDPGSLFLWVLFALLVYTLLYETLSNCYAMLVRGGQPLGSTCTVNLIF